LNWVIALNFETSHNAAMKQKHYMGIDLGTSGCRVAVIDQNDQTLFEHAIPWSTLSAPPYHTEQDPSLWWEAVQALIGKAVAHLHQTTQLSLQAICVDGTSSTILAVDSHGQPLGKPFMYHNASCVDQARILENVVPENSAARGPGASLAKALALVDRYPNAKYLCHQSDWINGHLCGVYGVTDTNNALKLGFDPVSEQWPGWMQQTGIPQRLIPRVVRPGTSLGKLDSQLCEKWKLKQAPAVVAGTTDSTAAFIATGANQVGDAVSCLGSTIVLKILSDQPIFSNAHGVYSHRLGDSWIVGGASNCGGAVLDHFFSLDQIKKFSNQSLLNLDAEPDYYPLLKPGERFPENNPDKQPKLEPRPKQDNAYFQGLLKSLVKVECDGYRVLTELGAPIPRHILTSGGGTKNKLWQSLRGKSMQIRIRNARHTEAAYGSALLAKSGNGNN
jgi:sugar (pentulose or hexulose) kinase